MKPSFSKYSSGGGSPDLPGKGATNTHRSGSSGEGSLPTQPANVLIFREGHNLRDANVSQTHMSTKYRHRYTKSGRDKVSVDTGGEGDDTRRGYSSAIESADEHLARGSVELAFLRYSQGRIGNYAAFEMLRGKYSRQSLEYVRRFMVKCNELFLFAKNQIDVGAHLRAESLLVSLLQFNREGHEELQHPLFQVRVLNLLASCQRHLGKLKDAEETLDVAMHICSEYNCAPGETLLTLGALQMDLQQYALAKTTCLECIRHLEPEIQDVPNKPEARFLATAYYNLGHCCMELGERGVAVNQYGKSLSILKRTFVSSTNSLFMTVQQAYQSALTAIRKAGGHQTLSDTLTNIELKREAEACLPFFGQTQESKAKSISDDKTVFYNPGCQVMAEGFEAEQGLDVQWLRKPNSLRKTTSVLLVSKKVRPQSSNITQQVSGQQSLKEVGGMNPAAEANKRSAGFIVQHRRVLTAHSPWHAQSCTGEQEDTAKMVYTQSLRRVGRKIKVKLEGGATLAGVQRADVTGPFKAAPEVVLEKSDPAKESSSRALAERVSNPRGKTAKEAEFDSTEISKPQQLRGTAATKIQRAWRRYYAGDGRRRLKMKARVKSARWVCTRYLGVEADLKKPGKKVFPCKVLVFFDRKSTLLDVYAIRRNPGASEQSLGEVVSKGNRFSCLKWIGWVEVPLVDNFFANVHRLRINERGRPYFRAEEKPQVLSVAPVTVSGGLGSPGAVTLKVPAVLPRKKRTTSPVQAKPADSTATPDRASLTVAARDKEQLPVSRPPPIVFQFTPLSAVQLVPRVAPHADLQLTLPDPNNMPTTPVLDEQLVKQSSPEQLPEIAQSQQETEAAKYEKLKSELDAQLSQERLLRETMLKELEATYAKKLEEAMASKLQPVAPPLLAHVEEKPLNAQEKPKAPSLARSLMAIIPAPLHPSPSEPLLCEIIHEHSTLNVQMPSPPIKFDSLKSGGSTQKVLSLRENLSMEDEPPSPPQQVPRQSLISTFQAYASPSKKQRVTLTVDQAAQAIRRFCLNVIERKRALQPFRLLRELRETEQGTYCIVIYRLPHVLSIRVAELKKKGFYDFRYLKLDEQLSQRILDPSFLQNSIVVIDGKIRVLDTGQDASSLLVPPAAGSRNNRNQIRDDLLNQISVLDENSESEGSSSREERQQEKEKDSKRTSPTSSAAPRGPLGQLPQIPGARLQNDLVEPYPPVHAMGLTRSLSLAKDFIMPYDVMSEETKVKFQPEAKIKSGGKESQQSSNGSKQGLKHDVLKLRPEAQEVSFSMSQRRISSPSVFHAPQPRNTTLSRDTKELNLPELLRVRFVSTRGRRLFWLVIKELPRGGFFVVEVEEGHRKYYIESLIFESELVGLSFPEAAKMTPKERAEWLAWKIAPSLSYVDGMGKPVAVFDSDVAETSDADRYCITGKYF